MIVIFMIYTILNGIECLIFLKLNKITINIILLLIALELYTTILTRAGVTRSVGNKIHL